MALSERMQAHVDRIGRETAAAGLPQRLTPEQQEEAIAASSLTEKAKRNLRWGVSINHAPSRIVVYSLWKRQHGYA
jgi:hypothetical protein